MIALISSSNRENLKKKNINIRKEKKERRKRTFYNHLLLQTSDQCFPSLN